MKKFEFLNEELMRGYLAAEGRRPLLPDIDERQQLALMCRMLFREGWDEHLAGHITYRLPDGRILSNPWELTWDEITASDIVGLNEKGEVVDGEWNITPAIGLHMQLHKARPDINVAVHNHPRWSGIWADMRRSPPIYDQAGAYVAGDVPIYDEYEGVLDDAERMQAAVEALGDAKWALLANHGSLVVGRDLRQAHLRVITLEWRSRRAWEVEAAGGGAVMDDGIAAATAMPDENGFPFLWEAMARREIRRDPGVLD